MTEDAVCVDVGANIGLSSLGLSHAAPRGRVYAFEPSPRAFEPLQHNLVANAVTNVHVFVIDRVDGSLARLSTPAEAYQFLYLNGIHGPADNPLCSFTEQPVERRFRLDGAVAGASTLDPTAGAAELEAMKQICPGG